MESKPAKKPKKNTSASSKTKSAKKATPKKEAPKKTNNKPPKEAKTSLKEEKIVEEVELVEEQEEDEKTSVIGIIVLVLMICLAGLLLFLRCSKQEETHMVTLDANDGSDVVEKEIIDKGNLVKPEDPEREGYEFMGWYVVGEDKEFDFDREITSDMKIEARWKAIETEELKGISLDEEITLVVDGTSKLEVKLDPRDFEDVSLVWSSSDEDIVSVDEDGNLTAHKKGKAKITVKTKDGKYEASCEVTVSDEAVKVKGITLEKDDITISINQELYLDYEIKPSNATNKEVTWSVEDKNIVSVDKDGKITGKAPGKTIVKVMTKDGKYIASVIVRVRGGNVTDISLSGDDEVKVGETVTLKATIKPSNADKTLTWTSSNPKVATVDKNGKVKGVKAGDVTITVKASNGKEATHKVKVVDNYVLTLTEIKTELLTFQYSVKVTKNGKTLNSDEYDQFFYNNEWYGSANLTVPSDQVTTKASGTKIKLNDGKMYSMTVKVVKAK